MNWSRDWLLAIALITFMGQPALARQPGQLDSQDDRRGPWQQPLPTGLEGLRLDHLRTGGFAQQIVSAKEMHHLSEWPARDDLAEFMVSKGQIVFLTRPHPVGDTGLGKPVPPCLIQRTRFADAVDAEGSTWKRPEVVPIATIAGPAKRISLVKFDGEKVFFSVDLPREIPTTPVYLQPENSVTESGFYVADNQGVRQVSMPAQFHEAAEKTVWLRYPANDQLPFYHYTHMGTGRNRLPWQNVDQRIFIYTARDSLFFTRNWMSDDGKRMIDVVEMDIASETFGDVASIQTNLDSRRAQKTGHPAVVSRYNLVFHEFISKNKLGTIDFRQQSKPDSSTLRKGYWHYDDGRKFLYLVEDLEPDSGFDFFRYTKIRVSDNSIVGKVKIANHDFRSYPGIYSGNSHQTHQPDNPFGYYQDILLGKHIYFFSRSRSATRPSNVIVKVQIDNPSLGQRILVPWRLPPNPVDIRVDEHYAYYIGCDWIVRVSHTDRLP